MTIQIVILIISNPSLGNRSRVVDFWINIYIYIYIYITQIPQLINRFNGLFGLSQKSIASAIKEVTSKNFKRKMPLNGYKTAINCFDVKIFKENYLKKYNQNKNKY